jgi:hypothetical protein
MLQCKERMIRQGSILSVFTNKDCIKDTCPPNVCQWMHAIVRQQVATAGHQVTTNVRQQVAMVGHQVSNSVPETREGICCNPDKRDEERIHCDRQQGGGVRNWGNTGCTCTPNYRPVPTNPPTAGNYRWTQQQHQAIQKFVVHANMLCFEMKTPTNPATL